MGMFEEADFIQESPSDESREGKSVDEREGSRVDGVREENASVDGAREENASADGVREGSSAGGYDDNAIQTLSWNEHIRRRPGMYIGKLGDGSHPEDGIYVLVKEVMDNSIDEFNMDAGKRIDVDVDVESGEVRIRDYGRGIPLGKVKEVNRMAKKRANGEGSIRKRRNKPFM